MATYKVIQDIEAEDKLLGPLTLRQFIFGIIAAVCFYLSFIVATKGAPFLLVIFLPPGLIAAFFAFPWGRDQPTEVWALAKIRFLLKPRRRVWNQTGIKELVTITAPKKIEKIYTNGLTQTEVKSRLRALADTIDSRGWVIKNVNVNMYAQPNLLAAAGPSDRLVDPNAVPDTVPTYDVQASDDIMDAQNNPVAHQFDEMITASSASHRQALISQLNAPTPPAGGAEPKAPADYWFLNQPSSPRGSKNDVVFANPPVVSAASDNDQASLPHHETADEKALASELKKRHRSQSVAYGHTKVIDPAAAHAKPAPTPPPVTPPTDPAILGLASNNDLNVATIAREANRQQDEPPKDEVVISLH